MLRFWRTPITGMALCVLALFSIVFEESDEAVNEAKELAGGGTLSIIGHSAGGWLTRVYMEEFGLSHISLLLTLGTPTPHPHLPPPKGSPGVLDQTRGLLNYVEKHCSKAVYTPELRYVCIAGSTGIFKGLGSMLVQMRIPALQFMLTFDQADSKAAVVNATSTSASDSATLLARFIGQGYKQVCGQADVWGDGVVPEVASHLEGALNISFDGVYHSPVGSDDASRPWYGSPAIVEQWIHHLLN